MVTVPSPFSASYRARMPGDWYPSSLAMSMRTGRLADLVVVIINSKFSPSWWLRNPHLQTVYASKLGHRPPVSGIRERVELPDGDFLDLHHGLATNGPLVALFHGLAGCVQSAYIRGIIHALEARGLRPVLMHWRGCSGEPNRLPRSYHSGASDDIAWLIDLLIARSSG